MGGLGGNSRQVYRGRGRLGDSVCRIFYVCLMDKMVYRQYL